MVVFLNAHPGGALVWRSNEHPGHHITITSHWLKDPVREQFYSKCECGWDEWNIAPNLGILLAARHAFNASR
ncbi:hypothetical protein [Nocardia sp. NPDC004604]|uniref:hypothetical protein n=1 Tax=Nocardia sp. NPDC004604 TaxID=3157013 RepID=UPI0033B50400